MMFRPLIAYFTGQSVTALGELPEGETLDPAVLPGGSVAQHEAKENPHSQYVQGSDERLSDARTPKAHTHAAADLSGVVKKINGVAPDSDGSISLSTEQQPAAATYTYTGGVLTTINETVSGAQKTTRITYNPNGTVATLATTYNGKTRTETYAYTAGKLSGMTAVEG